MKEVSNLIHSLSPVEKQHFKKRHNSSADFILLFDCLNKKKNCDTQEALDYLSKKGKKKKTYNSSYLSVVKSYLKSKILESLRMQYIHKKKTYELLSKSMNVDILLEKGLYEMARSEITSSYSSNSESSFPIERLLLLRRNSIIDYYENYARTDLDKIERLFDERLHVAEQLVLEIKIAKILSILSYQYFKGVKDTELLKSFMNEDYMRDESLMKDFSTKYLFHWVHAQFHEFDNNPEQAREYFKKSIQVWLDNPAIIEAHPRMYLGACYTFFKYQLHQKDPFTSLLDDMNIEVLLSKIKSEQLAEEEEEKYVLLFSLFKIIALRHKGEFQGILNLAEPILAKQKMDDLPDFDKIIYCYYAALSHFEFGSYKKAKIILEQYVYPIDKRLISNPVYTSVFIMLYLLVDFELGNIKHLRFKLTKLKQYLQKENKFTSFEEHFFNMLSQLIADRYKENQELVYARFYQRLSVALDEGSSGIKAEYEYLISWVKKKEQLLNN